MSNTAVITIMTVAELIVITIVLVTVLMRNKTKKIQALQRQVRKIKQQQTSGEPPPAPKLETLLDAQISDTQSYLSMANEEQAALLNKRIEFLQSEKQALEIIDSRDPGYWEKLCTRLSSILPEADTHRETADKSEEIVIQSIEEPGDELEPMLIESEQDDMAAIDDMETIIAAEPVDTNNMSTEDAVNLLNGDVDNTDAAADAERERARQSEKLSKLQNTIDAQESELDQLKTTLAEKNSELARMDDLLQKLQESEDAHTQLNTCIATLEKENANLLLQLQDEKTKEHEPAENEPDPDAVAINDELELAKQTIESLNQDLTGNEIQIRELQDEVQQLTDELRRTTEQRDKLLQQEHDLSVELDMLSDSDDPEVLNRQIEQLTDMIVKKSEELSALQQDDIPSLSQRFSFTNHDIVDYGDDGDYAVNDSVLADTDVQMLPPDLSEDMRQLLDSHASPGNDADQIPPVLSNNERR